MRVHFAADSDRSKLDRFNDRLREGGRRESIPSLPDPIVNYDGLPIFRRLLVAEDGLEVRAGALLLHHRMFLNGEPRRFCFVQMPVSEGLVNRAHSLAILQVVKEAMAYEGFLISLGVGSLTEGWARFVVSQRWRHAAVPFLFLPLRMNRVLRGLRYLEKRSGLAALARMAAITGGGALGGSMLNAYRRWKSPSIRAEVVAEFGDWADEVFAESLPDYEAIAQRDREALQLLYPPSEQRFVRLRVPDSGWVVVSLLAMRDHKFFGDLTVGVVVDGLGRAANASILLAAATDHLESHGADLVVANWSHAGWVRASRKLGFFEGPSNYFVFIAPSAPHFALSRAHFTRGDSDGMVNLRPPTPAAD